MGDGNASANAEAADLHFRLQLSSPAIDLPKFVLVAGLVREDALIEIVLEQCVDLFRLYPQRLADTRLGVSLALWKMHTGSK
jgi:hypothetical protein